MLRRDPERLQRLRIAVRYLLTNDKLVHGHQRQLAEHFSMTRQRVNQVVAEEETRTGILRRKRQRVALAGADQHVQRRTTSIGA